MCENKKVLIIQCFNPNKGDNSVAQTMVDSVKSEGIEVELTAFLPVKARKEMGVNAYDYLFSLREAKYAKNKFRMAVSLLKESLWLAYSLCWIAAYRTLAVKLFLPATKREIIKAYQDADLVVLPGGHFFTCFNSLVNNFSHWYAMKMAQWMGKPTTVYAQTLGPFGNSMAGLLEKLMMKDVLSNSVLVTVREADSLNVYHGGNVRLTAETVFIKPIETIPTDLRQYTGRMENGECVIGVTIHHIYYKHYFSTEEYLNLMVGIFNRILASYKCHILLIPMEDNVGTGGDRPIIRTMMDMTGNKDRIHTIDADCTSMQTANIIAACDAFVGTKTHSVVYGLKTSKPTLSISYQQKSTEFMKMFGMADYAINLKDMTQETFMEKFSALMENRDQIHSALEKANPKVRALARENNVLLKEILYAE